VKQAEDELTHARRSLDDAQLDARRASAQVDKAKAALDRLLD
jgi:hypothetical protein